MSGAKVGIIPERGDTLKMDIVTIFTALLCRSVRRTDYLHFGKVICNELKRFCHSIYAPMKMADLGSSIVRHIHTLGTVLRCPILCPALMRSE